jgi:hypothetical protein
VRSFMSFQTMEVVRSVSKKFSLSGGELSLSDHFDTEDQS